MDLEKFFYWTNRNAEQIFREIKAKGHSERINLFRHKEDPSKHEPIDTWQACQESAVYEYVVRELGQRNDPSSRARFAHEILDALTLYITKVAPAKISCKKGCAFCCYIRTEISEDEAALLASRVLPDRQAQLKRQAEDPQYATLPYPQRRCVFLDEDNSCSVYEDRPSVCRRHAVKSDPRFCDTSQGSMRIEKLNSVLPNIVTAAVLSYNAGTMAQRLLEKIDERQKST